MEDCLLSLRHIVKSFGEGNVLDDISLNVQRGEFVTLLGASGCGKTTTLRVISGLETPDEGQVVLDGRDVTLLPPESRPVNTVFQSYALFPHMSVEKNVAYGLRVQLRGDCDSHMERWAVELNPSHHGNREPAPLNPGTGSLSFALNAPLQSFGLGFKAMGLASLGRKCNRHHAGLL